MHWNNHIGDPSASVTTDRRERTDDVRRHREQCAQGNSRSTPKALGDIPIGPKSRGECRPHCAGCGDGSLLLESWVKRAAQQIPSVGPAQMKRRRHTPKPVGRHAEMTRTAQQGGEWHIVGFVPGDQCQFLARGSA